MEKLLSKETLKSKTVWVGVAVMVFGGLSIFKVVPETEVNGAWAIISGALAVTLRDALQKLINAATK